MMPLSHDHDRPLVAHPGLPVVDVIDDPGVNSCGAHLFAVTIVVSFTTVWFETQFHTAQALTRGPVFIRLHAAEKIFASSRLSGNSLYCLLPARQNEI